MDMRFKFASVVAVALVLSACVPPANAPAAYTPYAPQPTYGAVAGGTMAALEITNAASTAQVLIATGDAFNAQAAQSTADAQSTQQAIVNEAKRIELQSTVAAATEQASAKATGTAIVERQATQTAETSATGTQAAHAYATATGQAGARATEIADANLQQTLAERRIWATSLESMTNNAVVVCTGAIVALAIVGLLYLTTMAYLRARAEWLKQKRMELMPAGSNGYHVLTSDGWVLENYPALSPPEPIEQEPAEPPAENAEAARVHGWRIAAFRLAMFAHAYDWPFDVLGPEGISVVERADWDRLTDFLFDCGYILKRERSRTRWAEDKSYKVFREETRLGFPQPFPPETAPIVHNPRCTEAQLAQIAQKAQKRKAVVVA